MSESLHILVLAYVYPPDAGSGTFRTLYFMNNLAAQGVKISVVTVKREDFHPEANVDEELVKKIHPDIKVIRCAVSRPLAALVHLKNSWFGRGAGLIANSDTPSEPVQKQTANTLLAQAKDAVSGLLACPDQHVGWIPDVLRKGKQLQGQLQIDCIYATGGPWSSVLAGALLSQRTGIPLIADFRDPWVSNPGFTAKPALIKYLERKMEAYVIRRASRIIANTDELREDFKSRYPFLNDANTHTITNGFERLEGAVRPAGKKHFSIVHAGELYMSRNPANLLEAIESLIREQEVDQDLFRIRFVGGISIKDVRLKELMQSPYLENLVEVYPRVSHQEAIALQQDADALLLIQPDFPVQIPRKLFEYVSLQKPILAITEASSATGNIIRKKNLGMVVENSEPAIKSALLNMYRLWEANGLLLLNLEEVSEFQNDVLARKLGTIISEMSGDRKPNAY